MQDTHCTPADILPAAAPSGLPARRRGHLVRLGQALAIASCLAGTAQADTGAAAAWPLLPAACAILREMASFTSAGVATKAG